MFDLTLEDMQSLAECLAGDEYYRDQLHTLANEECSDDDLIRIAKTIRDCIGEAKELMEDE